MGLGYLVFGLAINVVIRVYLLRDLWVRVLAFDRSSTASRRPPTSPAKGELANALGEGFADGLDVAGF